MVVSSYFGCIDEGKTLQVSSANSRKESLTKELMLSFMYLGEMVVVLVYYILYLGEFHKQLFA